MVITRGVECLSDGSNRPEQIFFYIIEQYLKLHFHLFFPKIFTLDENQRLIPAYFSLMNTVNSGENSGLTDIL